MNIVNIILSGGVGSRLWPVSRKSMPKQYLPLFGNKSLFQLTVERNLSLVSETIVVGNKENYLLSESELMKCGVDEATQLIEATPRNTAAAIAFAALAVEPDDILLVTPSDHIITNELEYAKAVARAAELASEGYLVTFGVVPTKAETGYGYIEFEGNDVVSFKEKPDSSTAALYVESGRFLWNSGMFCFKAGNYLQELEAQEPEIYAQSCNAYANRTNSFLPYEETMQIPSVSVDYAVMERSKNIKVLEAKFGWSDLGSFESVWEHWEKAGENHRFIGNNCVVGSAKHVEFLGVDNLVLVETADAILVLDKSSSQHVKKIYERLEKEKPELV